MAIKRRTSISPKQLIGIFVVLGMLVVTYIFANSYVQKSQTLSAGAASGQATIFFEPETATLPPNATIRLWVTADKPLAYARIIYTFDPKQIQLAEEITITNTAFKKIFELTPKATANTTGKVIVAIGLDPTTRTLAPTGSFALASMKFAPVTASAATAQLAVSTDQSQLVDNSALLYSVQATNATLSLNPPAASPSPTPAPSTGATSTETLTPIADTTAFAKSPNTNFGTQIRMTAASDPAAISFLKFDLSSLAGKTITGAALRLYVKNNTSGSSVQTIRLVPDTAWSESALTYNTRPVATDVVGSLAVAKNNTWIQGDLTGAIAGYAGKTLTLSLDNNSTDDVQYASRENTEKPQLLISYR